MIADRTSKIIQKEITNLGLKKLYIDLDITDYMGQLKSKQESLDKFYKKEWFPTVKRCEPSEVPNKLWNKKNFLEDSVNDLQKKIEDAQSNIKGIEKRIESLEEELHQVQEKEAKEAKELAEENSADILEEEQNKEPKEEEPGENKDNQEPIREGQIETVEQSYEDPVEEPTVETNENSADILEEEQNEEPKEEEPGENKDNQEPIREEQIEIVEQSHEEAVKGSTEDILIPNIFKEANKQTRVLKAIPIKKKWTEIIMNKLKELAKKGKDAINNFLNR